VSKKKSAGRPVVPKSKALAKYFSVRMRPDEAREVMSAVKKSDLTQSEWIRKTLLDKAREKD